MPLSENWISHLLKVFIWHDSNCIVKLLCFGFLTHFESYQNIAFSRRYSTPKNCVLYECRPVFCDVVFGKVLFLDRLLELRRFHKNSNSFFQGVHDPFQMSHDNNWTCVWKPMFCSIDRTFTYYHMAFEKDHRLLGRTSWNFYESI